jgi:hypothetical protein
MRVVSDRILKQMFESARILRTWGPKIVLLMGTSLSLSERQRIVIDLYDELSGFSPPLKLSFTNEVNVTHKAGVKPSGFVEPLEGRFLWSTSHQSKGGSNFFFDTATHHMFDGNEESENIRSAGLYLAKSLGVRTQLPSWENAVRFDPLLGLPEIFRELDVPNVYRLDEFSQLPMFFGFSLFELFVGEESRELRTYANNLHLKGKVIKGYNIEDFLLKASPWSTRAKYTVNPWPKPEIKKARYGISLATRSFDQILNLTDQLFKDHRISEEVSPLFSLLGHETREV